MTKTRRLIWLCLGVGVAIHLWLTQIGWFEAERQAAKPLTIQFVKRAPRLAKPLELRKRPQAKRRQMQRQMVSVQVRADVARMGLGLGTVQALGSLTRPRALVFRSVLPTQAYHEQRALAETIQSTKDVAERVDVSLEMMDVQTLDTGKYHAMVIQDPSDKRGVRGFFHLGQARSRNMFLGRWASLKPRFVRAMARLAGAVNKYTGVRADLWGTIELDSEELLKTPWVYVMAAFSLRFTESESENFGAYLLSGGMAFLDDLLHVPDGPGDLALRQLLIAALSTQGLEFGKDWHFERLPNSHAIYHCYFDFDGPPVGVCLPTYFAKLPVPGNTVRLADYLEGVYLGGRMAAIVSNQSYANAWGDWGKDGTTKDVQGMYGDLDPTRPLQFGVNVIIFALTQEGSITRQVMESVNY